MSRSELRSLGLRDRDGLDEALGGGLPQGSIVLVEGAFGAGKSAFAQRASYGLWDEGATVSYLSTELAFGGFLDQMRSLSYDVTRPVLSGEFLYLSGVLDRAGASLLEGNHRLLDRLMAAETLWRPDVVVVDAFHDVLRNDPGFEALVREDDHRQEALEIISFLRTQAARGTTVVLTVDPSTVDDVTVAPFRSIADVRLRLRMIQVGNDTRRNLEVTRFAGNGDRVGSSVGYAVREGTGIIIENRSVA